MAEVTIKLDSPIITTDKSISEITTDGLANTGEIALATDGIVGNVNGALRKYPNPIKTFYVENFVATGMAKWGFEPKDVKTNDIVMIKTATKNLIFTVAEATESKAILCAFTKNGGTRIVMGQKVGSALIGYSYERVADYYSGKTYEYSLSEDLSLTGVTPFTKIEDAERCVPSYYTNHSSGKNYLRLKYNSEELLPIGASYNDSSGHSCVFYFIINHKGQQKLVVFQVSAFLSDDPITTSLSFVDLGFSPFNLTIGKTTKQINGTADVSFSAEEITDKFNGALILNLTTASTEADIRKAFTEVNAKTVLFPTPGSIISKLDGDNRGIVVSLSDPDATTLGRSIVVYYGDGTYTIVVKNDFTKVLVPWRKDSSLRDLYISAGAKYNEQTGYYELNGLTDITEEQMRKIYMLYITNSPKAEHIVSWLSFPNDFRTNIAPRVFYVSNIQNSIGGNSVLEVLVLSTSSLYIQNSAATAHGSFPKLRRVVGYWAYANNNPSNYNFGYGQPFGNCPLLEEIRMKGINKSHTFAVSPNLSKESVLYMITNANPPSGAAAGSITITLHPTAYARLKDDADIVAALEAKGGIITLVSA